jgi:hypothetical protein
MFRTAQKKRKRPTNNLEQIKMKIKPMRLQNKQERRNTTKNYCVTCEES